jgi:hypothetical protein
MSPPHLLSILTALECELQEPETRKDAGRIDELLHPSFTEFARAGDVYTRAQLLEHLAREARMTKTHSRDFGVELLAADVALLTYKSAQLCADGSLDRHTLRSSVWKLGTSGWQMVFHQGTPTQSFTWKAP